MTQPRQVLDTHAQITDVFRHRNPAMAAWLRAVAEGALGDPVMVGVHVRDDTLPEEEADEVVRQARLMFYPHNPFDPEGIPAFMGDVGRELFEARTLQVDGPIVRMLDNAAGEVREAGDLLLDAEIPWDNGFAWLDEPLVTYGHGPDGVDEDAAMVRAVSWAKIPAWMVLERGGTRRKCRAVRVMFWTSLADVGEETRKADPYWAQRAAMPCGDLMPSHSMVLPLGHRFVPTDAEPGTPELPVQAGVHVMRFVHALWMFMDMEITTFAPAGVPRQGRKRAAGRLRRPDVDVILLRRSKTVTNGHDGHLPRDVEWTCRWFVRGHHRHLDADAARLASLAIGADPNHPAAPGPGPGKDHCGICGTRISRFIHPYLKGPDGLPIRDAKHMFRLAR